MHLRAPRHTAARPALKPRDPRRCRTGVPSGHSRFVMPNTTADLPAFTPSQQCIPISTSTQTHFRYTASRPQRAPLLAPETLALPRRASSPAPYEIACAYACADYFYLADSFREPTNQATILGINPIAIWASQPVFAGNQRMFDSICVAAAHLAGPTADAPDLTVLRT